MSPDPDLARLFDPDRVVVVGATDRNGSIGRALVENLATFDGTVAPVNPNRETVFDRACLDSVAEVPDVSDCDLFVVAVPADVAVEVVEAVGEAGGRYVVVISAGFAETDEAGARRERALTAVAERHDLALVGPNCVGVLGAEAGLNATFVAGSPPEGSVSLLSQSGAFVAATLAWADAQGVGFRHVVSLGNEAVLDETDFVSAWDDDPGTEVILAYVEDVEDGRRFVETARAVTTETPVLALKSGRTAAGAAAAASHTGSMAGTEEAYDAAFRQAGVIRPSTVQAAFDGAWTLVGQPLPATDGVAVVTNGGGPGVLATDAVGDSRLSVAEFGTETCRTLRNDLPKTVAIGNPLDVVGDADVGRFRTALDAVLGDGAVGCAVVICVETALVEFEELARVVREAHECHGVPVVACLMGGTDVEAGAAVLNEAGIPSYFDPARAVGSLDTLAAYQEVRGRTYGEPTTFDVDRERAAAVLNRAVERGVDLLGVEAMDLLDAYGVPIPAGDLAESADEAETIAGDVGGPVAMKVASPDVVHKSDAGGVVADVAPEAAGETYDQIVERVRAADPDARILGVRVEELVAPDDATETIVGAKRDPQFGHLLMFGLGGIFVQIFEDTAFRVAPVTERDARSMTEEIRAAPMLRGARGRAPADVDDVVETVQRISQLVTDFPAITELDVNPLVASPDVVRAVDFRLTLDREAFAARESGCERHG
jgi:acetyltransferase